MNNFLNEVNLPIVHKTLLTYAAVLRSGRQLVDRAATEERYVELAVGYCGMRAHHEWQISEWRKVTSG